MILPNGIGGIIILPDAQNQEEEKCPKCKKAEELVTACGHCGYVYPDEEDTGFPWKGFLIVLFCSWLGITIFVWILNLATEPKPTSLVDCFIVQYHFVIKMFHNII